MLTRQLPRFAAGKSGASQDGVVLLIALIMLVAMTLGGIALLRSVYGTNIVAGNMAFQQSATNYADIGIEAAMTRLAATTNVLLEQTPPSPGYIANSRDPNASEKNWDGLWQTWVAANQVMPPVVDPVSGNRVSYLIQRLCTSVGPVATSQCAVSPAIASNSGNDMGAGGSGALNQARQVYYRITARVDGPRNTVSYVQAVIAK